MDSTSRCYLYVSPKVIDEWYENDTGSCLDRWMKQLEQQQTTYRRFENTTIWSNCSENVSIVYYFARVPIPMKSLAIFGVAKL